MEEFDNSFFVSQSYCSSGPAIASVSQITFKESKEEEKPVVVAVIVTILSGTSFDPLYDSIPQESPEGIVSVYKVSYSVLPMIEQALVLEKEFAQEDLHVGIDDFNKMIREIRNIDASAVVFNWECCDGCSLQHFPDQSYSLKFARFAISRGSKIIFSDFSLKALIKTWTNCQDSEFVFFLGPCPLITVGESGKTISLRFDTEKVKDCQNTQLEIVGALVGEKEAHVHALGGTIVFSVDLSKTDASEVPYELILLSIDTASDGGMYSLSIGEHRGSAGHVLLKYSSGGTMLLSKGHWIELVKLDTSVEDVIRVARANYGDAFAGQLEVECNSGSLQEQAEAVQTWAKRIVQSNAPTKASKSKLKF